MYGDLVAVVWPKRRSDLSGIDKATYPAYCLVVRKENWKSWRTLSFNPRKRTYSN